MNAENDSKKLMLYWIPMAYLFTVAGFQFDGWYHAVVGRDQFWIAPPFFCDNRAGRTRFCRGKTRVEDDGDGV